MLPQRVALAGRLPVEPEDRPEQVGAQRLVVPEGTQGEVLQERQESQESQERLLAAQVPSVSVPSVARLRVVEPREAYRK